MSKPVDVLVAGGGGFIGGHLVGDLLSQGRSVRAVDVKPHVGVVPGARRTPRTSSPTCPCSSTRWRRPRARARSTCSPPTWAAWASSRTTRHCACSRCSPAPTCCRPPSTHEVERYFYSSSACVYAADKQTDTDVTALKEADAYPAHARGRLRLGEAVHRADVPALPRGLRPDHPGRPLPQRLRPARHLDRRPREGPGRGLPQDRDRGDHRRARASRSGATASRPAASCTSTTACRARQMILEGDSAEPVNLGSSELVSINQLVDIVEEHRRHPLRARLPARRAAGCARPQQRQHPDPRDLRLGALDHARSTVSSETYRWVYDQVKRSLG